MAKRKDVSPAEAAKNAKIVDVSEVMRPAKRPSPKDDPENYERREHDGIGYYSPTHKRAEELRELVQEHMKPLEPEFGWKGQVEAVVPEAIAADVAEAMNFVGALVDEEMEQDGGMVRLFSEGYWAHGF